MLFSIMLITPFSYSPLKDSHTTTNHEMSYEAAPHARIASAYPPLPEHATRENTLRAWGLGALHSETTTESLPAVHGEHRRRRQKGHPILLHSRWAAFFASLVHLIPVAGTAVITWYIRREYFIGDQLQGKFFDRNSTSNEKFRLLGLQVAAKVHELCMVATLTTVIFAMVRNELARGSGVPLAFMTAGFSVSKISFLWSKEFGALCRARYDTWYKKALFLFTILVCVLLSIAVAPASATALTPIYRSWPAGGTRIWLNNTQNQLFPTTLDESHTLGTICNVSDSHDECPSAHWQDIRQGYFDRLPLLDKELENLQNDSGLPVVGWRANPPLDVTVAGRNRRFELDVVSNFIDAMNNEELFDPYFSSLAKAEHVAVTDALHLNYVLWKQAGDVESTQDPVHAQHRFEQRGSARLEAQLPYPIVHTGCYAGFSENNDTVKIPWFPKMNLHWVGEKDRLLSPDDSIDEFGEDEESIFFNSTQLYNWALTASKSSRPELLWIKHPFGNTSIGAAISLPNGNSTKLWGCTIDARWVMNEKIVVFPELRVPRERLHNNTDSEWLQWDNWGYPQVTIRPSFAQYTNPRLPTSNKTVFDALLDSIRYQELMKRFQPRIMNPYLETILNTMLVNGMARTAPYTVQHGILPGFENDTAEWWHSFMPKGQFGKGGDAYTLTPEQKENSFSFQMDVLADGYGYSYKYSRTSRVTLIILLIQLGIALAFILWSLATGTTSSSWDTPEELIALAFASEAPSNPSARRGLATGEAPKKFLKKRYCVVAEGSRVQLKEYEGRVRPENRVMPNVVYE